MGLVVFALLGYGFLQSRTAPSGAPSPRPAVSTTVAPAQLVRLGRDLRADREFGGQMLEDAATQAHISEERLAGIENGLGSAPTENELRELARVYALPKDLQEKRMTDAGHTPGQ